MKRILYSILLFVLPVMLFAQAPQKLSYQAVIRNSSNELVTNQEVSMKMTILQGSVSGKEMYSEKFSTLTNVSGLVSLEIGTGTVISGVFSDIDWSNGPYFIKTETDPKGGDNYTISGTSQLLSVPFALYAQKAGNGFSGNYNDLTDKPDFSKWDKDSTDNVMLAGNQTIAGNKTFTGTTTVPTPVNASDAATKAYVDILIGDLYMQGTLRLKDIDGNYYNVVRIGSQIWMAENLKTTKYNDGTAIPNVTDNTVWTGITIGAYCWYNNDAATYKAAYGALYNWYTVGSGKLCPVGWHVPSESEWITLSNFLGGTNIAGGKLKEMGTTHWTTPNTSATNETGFTATPGGYRFNSSGVFTNISNNGYWWNTNEYYSNTEGGYVRLNYNNGSMDKISWTKTIGFSVRCLRD